MTIWARPGWRWGLILLICLGTSINYLARNSLAVLAPELEKLMGFGAKEYSYIIGGFQLAYTVMQPVCGRMIDWLGVRSGFALFAVAWSVFGMLHAGASGWLGLAALRVGLGASEATAIPAGVKVIGEWFKGAARSAGVGWLNVGTSFGAMLAPPFTVFLAARYGWRSPFIVIGFMGIAWAALWWLLYRSPAHLQAKRERVAAGPILRTRRFWAIAIPRFLAEPAWQTFSFWIPLYLHDERGWDLKTIALFAWAPFLFADLGGIVGGYASPLLIRLFGTELIRSRVLTFGIGAFLMIAPGCVALAGSPVLAMVLLCVGGLAHQIVSTAVTTLASDVFPSQQLAAATGWVGASGWVGGLLFSLLIGQVVGVTGYGPLFAALAVFDLLGFAILLVTLRGVRPIETESPA